MLCITIYHIYISAPFLATFLRQVERDQIAAESGSKRESSKGIVRKQKDESSDKISDESDKDDNDVNDCVAEECNEQSNGDVAL